MQSKLPRLGAKEQHFFVMARKRCFSSLNNNGERGVVVWVSAPVGTKSTQSTPPNKSHKCERFLSFTGKNMENMQARKKGLDCVFDL